MQVLPGIVFDDADRRESETARQVLHQADDLAAAHAERRFHFEARNHGTGRCADHRDRHFEFLQSLLDQEACLDEFFLGDRLDVGVRGREQVERGQFDHRRSRRVEFKAVGWTVAAQGRALEFGGWLGRRLSLRSERLGFWGGVGWNSVFA